MAQLDGDDLLEILWTAQKFSGLKLKPATPPSIKIEELEVSDIARWFVAAMPTTEGEREPCACLRHFDALKSNLQAKLSRKLRLQLNSRLMDIQTFLPRKARLEFDLICREMMLNKDDLLLLAIVTAFLIPMVVFREILHLHLGIAICLAICLLPVGLVLELLPLYWFTKRNRLFNRNRNLPPYLTMADLSCLSVLQERQQRPTTDLWTTSELRLLARLAVAHVFRTSVQKVPLRKKLKDL